MEKETVFKEFDVTNLWQIRVLDKYMPNHSGFIAGGCFKNILNKEAFKDIDIFFPDMDAYEEAVELWKSKEYVQEGWKFLYSNDRVTAFKHDSSKIVVELVCTIFGTPEEVLDAFDFTVTKMAYYKKPKLEIDEGRNLSTSYTYTIVAHKDFFEHLHTKRLVLDNDIPFPVSTFNRSFRYSKYGYSLCNESIKKLITSLSDVDMTDSDAVFYNSNGWD